MVSKAAVVVGAVVEDVGVVAGSGVYVGADVGSGVLVGGVVVDGDGTRVDIALGLEAVALGVAIVGWVVAPAAGDVVAAATGDVMVG